MSMIRIDTRDGVIDKVTKILAGIPGGAEKALTSALQRTASNLRTSSADAIRERYAISKSNIRANENVKIKKSINSGNIEFCIEFMGNKIPLYRYDGVSPKSDTRENYTVNARINGTWLRVRPSVSASGHQLKGTSPTKFDNAFIATMKSGHTGIFERTGGSTSKGGDAIQEIMGSSVPQMLGNQEVLETLSKKAVEKFEERANHEIMRILNGWG